MYQLIYEFRQYFAYNIEMLFLDFTLVLLQFACGQKLNCMQVILHTVPLVKLGEKLEFLNFSSDNCFLRYFEIKKESIKGKYLVGDIINP